MNREKVKSTNEWTYHPDTSELVHQRYSVDLERCKNAAAVLDWIFQVANKSWCTPQTIYDLLMQLDEILKPQANLCPFGMAREKNQ